MRILTTLSLLSVLSLVTAAHADTFDFTASGNGAGYSGSGTLTTTNNNNGSYTITGISGTDITGLIAPAQFDNNDNLLFPTSPSLFDTQGFAFTAHMTDTDFRVDIASNGAGGYVGYFVDSDNDTASFPIDITVAPIPEPSTIALLGTAILGLAGLTRRHILS